MTFEEMVKDGRKFTSNSLPVTIVNSCVYDGISDIMLGVYENGSYGFFNQEDGSYIGQSGKKYSEEHNINRFDLVVVEEEKEGWFAIVNVKHRKLPVLSGIFETKKDCEETTDEIYKGLKYEIHKIIYKVN